jgi:hypothetical protein
VGPRAVLDAAVMDENGNSQYPPVEPEVNHETMPGWPILELGTCKNKPRIVLLRQAAR